MNKKEEIIILFDLDGTLIDSTDAIIGCFYHSFEELNFDFKGSKQDIKNEIGYPLDVMYETLGVPRDNVWDFVTSYKKEYNDVFEGKTTLLSNAYEAVVEAATFSRLGIVTTKTTKFTLQLLQNFGILDYFETVIGRQEVTHPKPNPEPILKALEMMNVTNSNNIYMIGDTKLDLISAQKAKVNGIGVLCGYGKKEELECYTNAIYNGALEAVSDLKISTKNNFI
jgi:phosphoglycolate phosphatase